MKWKKYLKQINMNTKRNEAINEVVDKLQPVVLEEIYNLIDWQMDDEIEEMDGDEYMKFHNEVFQALLKQLSK